MAAKKKVGKSGKRGTNKSVDIAMEKPKNKKGRLGTSGRRKF